MTLDVTRSPLLSAPVQTRRAETELSFYIDTLSHLYKVANAAFAEDTRTLAEPGLELGKRTTASTTADPELVASTTDAPELRALEQLRGWLNLSYEQLAAIVGLSPSVIHHWRRRHREGRPVRPRASSVEQLWRVHSALRAVAEALDGEDPGYGVQLWARSDRGGTSPLELLTQGRVGELEERAGLLLFDHSPRRVAAWQLVAPEVEVADEPIEASRTDYENTDFG